METVVCELHGLEPKDWCVFCQRADEMTRGVKGCDKAGSKTPTYREFVLQVQVVSDNIEALSLIEQILQMYPNVDRFAVGRYLSASQAEKAR